MRVSNKICAFLKKKTCEWKKPLLSTAVTLAAWHLLTSQWITLISASNYFGLLNSALNVSKLWQSGRCIEFLNKYLYCKWPLIVKQMAIKVCCANYVQAFIFYDNSVWLGCLRLSLWTSNHLRGCCSCNRGLLKFVPSKILAVMEEPFLWWGGGAIGRHLARPEGPKPFKAGGLGAAPEAPRSQWILDSLKWILSILEHSSTVGCLGV
jgi:hypothetical protein